MSIDEAFSTATALFSEFESHLHEIETEQDARLQIINRILTEVLGWPFRDIRTEPHSDSGYTDYLISSSGTRCFVVEAKRVGHLLVDTLNPKFSQYKVGGAAISSAFPGVQQAVKYCVDHGVNYAALTNGLSWIAFQPFPANGQSYKERQAFVFPDLQSIRDNFSTFYDLFSRSGVSEKTYSLHFAKADGLSVAEFEPLAAVNRAEDLRLIPKSSLASDLEPIFREFFGSLSSETDRDMLLECFVETRESHLADANLEKIVRNIAGSIEAIESSTGDLLAHEIAGAVATGRGESVLIVGNKGAGKSTFIERFFEIVLASEIRKKCLVIRIDLLEPEGDTQSINAWLNNKIRQTIEQALFADGHPSFEELQGLYWRDYQRWMVGQYRPLYDADKQAFKIKFGDFLNDKIEIDVHGYIIRLLEDAVNNRKLLPCLIFDNADHHSQEFQDAVFQFSQSLQKAVPFTFVVMPITDRSLWRLSKSGPFQTYAAKMFYLPVPSPKEVLERRIEFIQRKISESKDPREYFVGRGIRLNVENIRAFAASLEELFIREEFVARRITAQRVAITHSGRMHYEFAMRDKIYLGQMAFATQLRGGEVLDQLRAIKTAKMSGDSWDTVRHTFAKYCLDEDRRFARPPTDSMYDGQRQLRSDFEAMWVFQSLTTRDQIIDASGPSATDLSVINGRSTQTNWSYLTGEVMWFNEDRGFGFVNAQLASDIFIHVSTLRKAGIQFINTGDKIVCDVSMHADGKLQAIAIHSVEEGQSEELQSSQDQEIQGEVEFFNSEKGFGFIKTSSLDADVYLSLSVMKAGGIGTLQSGAKVGVTVAPGTNGKGYRALSIHLL